MQWKSGKFAELLQKSSRNAEETWHFMHVTLMKTFQKFLKIWFVCMIFSCSVRRSFYLIKKLCAAILNFCFAQKDEGSVITIWIFQKLSVMNDTGTALVLGALDGWGAGGVGGRYAPVDGQRHQKWRVVSFGTNSVSSSWWSAPSGMESGEFWN